MIEAGVSSVSGEVGMGCAPLAEKDGTMACSEMPPKGEGAACPLSPLRGAPKWGLWSERGGGGAQRRRAVGYYLKRGCVK